MPVDTTVLIIIIIIINSLYAIYTILGYTQAYKLECLSSTDPAAVLQSCYKHARMDVHRRSILYPSSPTCGGGIIKVLYGWMDG